MTFLQSFLLLVGVLLIINACEGQVVFRPFFMYKQKQQDKLNNRREQIVQQQLLQAEQAELALHQNGFYQDPYYYQYYQHPGPAVGPAVPYYPLPYQDYRINRKIANVKDV